MKCSNIVIYHRVDLDGIFSALIVKNTVNDCSVYGYNYGDDLSLIPNPKNYDKIFMVDVSFPPEIMLKYKESGTEIIWIDHHVTAIDSSISYGYANLPGLRRIGTAACELTWEFFNGPKIPAPDVIQLAGTWDVWNKTRFDWINVVSPFQKAMKATYGTSFENIQRDFNKLIYLSPEELDKMLDIGRVIIRYDNYRNMGAVGRFSFEILVDNRLPAICMIATEFSSTIFDCVANKYNLYCVVNTNTEVYSLSLYGKEECLGSFSCGEYLKNKYGGGGHKAAAGCQINFDTFVNLIKNKAI